MHTASIRRSGLITHDDQNRGVIHCYLEGIGCGGSMYNYASPDFYRLVPWDGARVTSRLDTGSNP